MQYPVLNPTESSRQTLEVFKGYNHNLRIGDGEFYDMENLTGAYYPVMAPREPRGVWDGGTPAGKLVGLIAKDALCYMEHTEEDDYFVMNGERTSITRLSSNVVSTDSIGNALHNAAESLFGAKETASDVQRQLVSMGSYVIILPDKKWINTVDPSKYGTIETRAYTALLASFTPCTLTGESIDATVSDTAPGDPANLDYWVDTSTTPHSLKQYSQTTGMWVSVATAYVKITGIGIGKAFEKYDGVTISGITAQGATALNGTTVIWDKGDDYIIVTGLLEQAVTQEMTVEKNDEGMITSIGNTISVQRTMPDMDFVVEAGNRLWGCKYGVNADGQVVNEIYCSKLGDFKNWNCFMGLSTDSWVGSVGTDGPFTGATTHLGYPVFFKENCLHKVYISPTGAHQIQDTACNGVQKGCGNSLAIVNSVLYYKSKNGIYAYDGSLPTCVSTPLGNVPYHNAVAGGVDDRYFVSMEDGEGGRHLFVYDTAKGLWHREAGFHALCLCSYGNELYAIDGDRDQLVTLLGSGTPMEDKVRWYAETGDMGLSDPDEKYISRLSVRLWLEPGTEVKISARYDHSGQWEQLCCLRGTSLRSVTVPIKPRRCDHLKLGFYGKGMAKIYAITKTIEQGSDVT